MTSLEALFTELEADGRHQWQRTADGAVDQPAYAAWPDDLKAFYRRYAWVRLFISGPDDFHNYRFLPLTEAGPAWAVLYGADSSAAEWGPASWVAICDVNDGQYLGLDVDSGSGRERNYIYFHPHTFALPGGSPI